VVKVKILPLTNRVRVAALKSKIFEKLNKPTVPLDWTSSMLAKLR
jgi:hypothetical protein